MVKKRAQGPKGTEGSAGLQRMVWKEARGRFSKLSPSRKQCSSRSSSGFAVPFMAPHEPRAWTCTLLARPRPELPAPASGGTTLPGALGEPNRRPPGAGSRSSPPRRGRGGLRGSRAARLPASGRDLWVRGGSGGGGTMAKVSAGRGPRGRCVPARRLPDSASEAGAGLRAACGPTRPGDQ